MKFLLVVAIYSATAGPTLTVLPHQHTFSECVALEQIYRAYDTEQVRVKTKCVLLPATRGWFW